MKTYGMTRARSGASAAVPAVHTLAERGPAGDPIDSTRFPDLDHTVRLLALIANDDAVSLDNRPRVVEALQNCGHLLCEEELETLRLWLGGLPDGGQAAGRRSRPARAAKLRWD